MRQVEPQALFNYYLIYTESFRLFVSDRVSLHLLLRYQIKLLIIFLLR
jgi:hypothetical protein